MTGLRLLLIEWANLNRCGGVAARILQSNDKLAKASGRQAPALNLLTGALLIP